MDYFFPSFSSGKKSVLSLIFLTATFLIILLFSYPCLADDINNLINRTDVKSPDIYEISSLPKEINAPGSYVLNISGNISDTAIKVTCSDVVINGNGNYLSGSLVPGTYGFLIEGEKRYISNVSIKNITLKNYDIGFLCDSGTNIRISDIRSESNLREGVKLDNCSFFSAVNCEITSNQNNISGGSGFVISDCSKTNLDRLNIQGNGISGKSNSGGVIIRNSSSVSINSCIISKNPGTGVIIDSGADNITLTNGEISYNQYGGIISTYNTDFSLINTIIQNNKGTGIELSHLINPVIKKNKIYYNSIGMSVSDSKNLVLSENIMNSNKIGFDMLASEISYYIHQIDNTNTINGRKLLYFNSQNEISIGDSDNPSMIILVNCKNIRVSDLVLSKNGAGIILAGSKNIILTNVAMMEDGIGVISGFNTSECSFSNLHAEKSLISGYYLTDSHNIKINSIYAQDSPSGLYLKHSSDIKISNITISGIYGNVNRLPSGLTISESPDVTVSHASVSGCNYAGLVSDSENLSIDNSSFSNNGIIGCILLKGQAEIKLSLFSGNQESGLILKTNKTKIISNTFYNNAKRGIGLISSGNNYIIDNSFQNQVNCELSGLNNNNKWNLSNKSNPDKSINGGNYWSNVNGTGFSDRCNPDKEGFCDKPYFLDTYNIDYLPLTKSDSNYYDIFTFDFNRNSRLDLQDVVLFMKNISSGNRPVSYDISKDGETNLKDVVDLFNLITKK